MEDKSADKELPEKELNHSSRQLCDFLDEVRTRLGEGATRLNGGIPGEMTFYDIDGHRLDNLIGGEGPVIALKSTATGFHLEAFTSDQNARDRRSTGTLDVIYQRTNLEVTEVQRLRSTSSAPDVEVRTTVKAAEDLVIIDISTFGGRQVAKFQHGMPSFLELKTDYNGSTANAAGRLLQFSFDKQGHIASVKLDGKDLKGPEAEKFIRAGEETLRNISKENGFSLGLAQTFDAPVDTSAKTGTILEQEQWTPVEKPSQEAAQAFSNMLTRLMQERTTNKGRSAESQSAKPTVSDATPVAKANAMDGPRQSTDIVRQNGEKVHVERVSDGTIMLIGTSNGIVWDRATDGSYALRGSNPPFRTIGTPFVKPNGDFGFTEKQGRSLEQIADATLVQMTGKTMRLKDDGSSQVIGADGKVQATEDALGGVRSIERIGNPPKVASATIGARTFNRMEGNHWKSKDGKEVCGEFDIDSDGNFSFANADNKLETINRTDGTMVLRSMEAHRGVLRTETKDGQATDYFRAADGKLIGMKLPDGSTYTRVPDSPDKPQPERWAKDGTIAVNKESRSVDADGTLRIKPDGAAEKVTTADGWERRTNAQGRQILTKELTDKSSVTKSLQGQILEARDSKGVVRSFSYDHLGQLNRISYGTETPWVIGANGKTWTKEGSNPAQSFDGKIDVTAEGHVVESRLENAMVRQIVRKNDASTIELVNGQVVNITRANGPTPSGLAILGYDATGKPNKVAYANSNGEYIATTNGTDWQKYSADGKAIAGEKSLRRTIAVTNDGTVTTTDLNNKRISHKRTDGSSTLTDLEGRKQGEMRVCRGALFYRYDETTKQLLGTAEYRDGTKVEQDLEGQVTSVEGDKVNRKFQYNNQNQVVGFEEDGRSYKLKDGTQDVYINTADPNKPIVALLSVGEGGIMQAIARDGSQTFHNNDGTTVTQRRDGAFMMRDEQGRMVETLDINGFRMRYEYGLPSDVLQRGGGLKRVQFGDEPGARVWTTDNGFNWTDNNKIPHHTFFSVDQETGALRDFTTTGDISYRGLNGKEHKEHRDVQSPIDVIAKERTWDTYKSTEERVIAEQLKDRTAEEIFVMGHRYDSNDQDRLRRELVEEVGGADFFRGVHVDGLFKRRDRETDYRAIQLMVNRSEQQEYWWSRDRSMDDIRREDHEILGSATEKDRIGIDTSLRAMYQMSLADHVSNGKNTHGDMQGDEFYRKSMELYALKGRDIRTSQEQSQIMDLGLRSKNPLDNFMIASGENIATDAHRAEFNRSGGKSRIRAAFTETGTDLAGDKYDIVDDFAVRQANDYLDRGKLKPATAILKATGTFSNEDEVINHTLQKMSKADQNLYHDGEALAREGKPREQMTDGQQEATDFYNEMQAALKGLHWFKNERKTFGYDAQIGRQDNDGIDLTAKLVEIGGHWFNDHQENLGGIENMSRASFDRLMEEARHDTYITRDGQNFRSEFQAKLHYGMVKNLGSGDYVGKAKAMIDGKIGRALDIARAADTDSAKLHELVPALRNIPEGEFRDLVAGFHLRAKLEKGHTSDGLHADQKRQLEAYSKNETFRQFMEGRAVARELEKMQAESPSKTREMREQFIRDLGKQGVIAYETYRTDLFGASQEVRRSLWETLNHNTGTFSKDRSKMWDAVKNMSPEDRQNYRHNAKIGGKSDGYQQIVSKYLDETFGAANPARTAINRVLADIAADKENLPKSPAITIVDELNIKTGLKSGSRKDSVCMVQDALRNDPGLRKRLESDQAFKQSFIEAATAAVTYVPAKGSATDIDRDKSTDYEKFISGLIDSTRGGLSPDALKELNIIFVAGGKDGGTSLRPDLDVKGYFKDGVLDTTPEALARLKGNAAERNALLSNIADPKLQQLASSILAEGKVTPEAQLRAFVLDAGVTKEQARQILASMGGDVPARTQLADAYQRKFQSGGSDTGNLRSDILGKLDKADRHEFVRLTRIDEWSADLTIVQAADAVSRANTGWVTSLARGYNISHEEALRGFLQERYLAQTTLDRGDLTPAELRQQWAAVNTATKSFHMTKESTSETIINGVIMAGAIVAAPFTGGTSLAALVATSGVIVTGGVVGAGLKYGLMGDTHRGRQQLLTDFVKYSILTAVNFADPLHFGATMQLGKTAAMQLGEMAATKAATKALSDATFTGLSIEARKAITEATMTVYCNGMSHGAGVTDQALQSMVAQLAKRNQLGGMSVEAQTQLLAKLIKAGPGAIDDVARSTLSQVLATAREVAVNRLSATALGTATNAIGIVGSSMAVAALEERPYTSENGKQDVLMALGLALPIVTGVQLFGAGASLARRLNKLDAAVGAPTGSVYNSGKIASGEPAVERFAHTGAATKEGAASPVDDLILRRLEGDKTVTDQQIQDALINQARNELRRMGLSDDVADALVDRKNLVLEHPSGNNFGGYSPRTDVLGVAALHPEALASKTVTHEVRHRKNTFDRTALQMADPKGFRAAIVDDVVSNAGRGGKRVVEIPERKFLGVITREREIKLQDRMLAGTSEARFMRDTLRKYLTERPNGELGSPVTDAQMITWMKKNKVEMPKGSSARNQQMLDEMIGEVNHANYVKRTSVIGDAAIKGNPALARALEEQATVLRKMSADGRKTMMQHSMRNRSLDTNALAGDVSRDYYRFSTEEIRARRSELSANLRQVHSDITDLVRGGPRETRDVLKTTASGSESLSIKALQEHMPELRTKDPARAALIESKLREMDGYANQIRFNNSMENLNRNAQDLRAFGDPNTKAQAENRVIRYETRDGKRVPGSEVYDSPAAARTRLNEAISEVMARTPNEHAGTVAYHLYERGLASGDDLMRMSSPRIAGEVANGLILANPQQFTPHKLIALASDAQMHSVASKLLEVQAVTMTDLVDVVRSRNLAAISAAILANSNPPVTLENLAIAMHGKGRLTEFVYYGIDGGAFSRTQVEEAMAKLSGSRHATEIKEILDCRPVGNDPPLRTDWTSNDIDAARAQWMRAPKDQPDAPKRLNPDEFPKRMKPVETGAAKTVEIDGQQYQLYYLKGWYHGKLDGGPEGAVKVHVTTDGRADLGKVQEALLPALKNDPELQSLVIAWKTMDPHAGLGLKSAEQVSGKGQEAKAFTIYTRLPEDAAKVQKILDRLLHEKGLALDRPIATGNVDSIGGASNRVGIVRDYYDVTQIHGMPPAAKLDLILQEHIHARMGLKPGDRLTPEQLRQVETAAGIESRSLEYDAQGNLALLVGGRSNVAHKQGRPQMYLDESRAVKEPGKLTDRHAYYALTSKFLPGGKDPVDLALGAVAHPPEFAPLHIDRAAHITVEGQAGKPGKPIKQVEKLKIAGREIEVQPGGAEQLIGRSHQTIHNSSLSRTHLTIGRTADGQYYIRDEGSTYGTYIKTPNEAQWRQVKGTYHLRGDEKIMMGGYHNAAAADTLLTHGPGARDGVEISLMDTPDNTVPNSTRSQPQRPAER